MALISRTPGPGTPIGRLAYLRLHADGLFLGLIAIAVGGRILLDPSRNAVSIEIGRVPASLLCWSVLLALGGAQLLIGMVWRDIRAELVGRIFIVVAFGWSTFGTARAFGATSPEARYAYLLLTIVVLIAAMRASALLARETIYVVYPGRVRPKADRAELVLAGSAEPEQSKP